MAKILHVVNISFVIPYYLGNQISYFTSLGNEIHIACTPDEKLYEYKKRWGFHTIGVKIKRSISPLEDIISVYKIARYIRKKNIDIVIGHTPKGALIAMTSAFCSSVKKRIYFRHGLMYETSVGFKRNMLIAIEKLTSRMATDVICVSQSVLDKSRMEKLSSTSKLTILNKGTCNGIDVIDEFNKDKIDFSFVDQLRESLEIDKSKLVIGFIGRLAKDKGINELIKAWSKVISANDSVVLLLAGPMDERDAIEKSTYEEINSNASILYVGAISDPKNYYALMDVFVLPSYREGFPTVILEASAMQLPIITTRRTGCVDSIVENITGIFTEIEENSIFSAIMFYLHNEKERLEHGKKGREFVRDNFSQKRIWQELEKEFA